jgi:sugar lactone lactonase YvrE
MSSGNRGDASAAGRQRLFAGAERGQLTTVAGVGFQDGVPAREAPSGWALGVVRRPDGDLIVCDYWGHRMWRIDRDGILHLFGGDGVAGTQGDGGQVGDARFREPHDLALDQHGNLFLSDLGNQTYRRIDAVTGVITRVAGTGAVGRGGDGGLASEAEMDTTCGIAIDRDDNLYLSSEWTNNIRRIDAKTGVIERFAGLDARHYPSERGQSRPTFGEGLSLMGYHGDGGPALEAAFRHPEHLAFDSAGDLYVCDNSNDRIRKIDMRSGIITTVLGNGQRASNGDGGLAVEASTLMPDAICLDPADNLYVGEKYGYRIRKVLADSGVVTTLVGNGVPGWGEEEVLGTRTPCNSVESGIWADPDQSVYWGDCSGRLRRYDGASGIVTTVLGGTSIHDGEPASAAFLRGPSEMAVAPDGALVFADSWNQRVRRIDPDSGIITTVAGNGARAYGGDGGPAVDAYLGNPQAVSVDTAGRVVVADNRHNRVRRVETDGTIYGICGIGQPWDKGDGGPAISACVNDVTALAHGPNDDVYIGDAIGRIRRIDAETGIITTVAGIGLPGYTGDGGPARAARIGSPRGLCITDGGSLYFTDARYRVVRRVDPKGIIHTVAGTGTTAAAAAPHDAAAATVTDLHAAWPLPRMAASTLASSAGTACGGSPPTAASKP